ncbi:nucleolar and spindle-associated protein 1 [Salarias fasciatus]|uniref:nucleolar and spindle-associated protein 1 n=1 Tax=Salarias fasciatus TaxID=181472 RepID=UPI001176C962|nr:nucleolar and spindle-associated protein 1 [Salarias fasciatus]
MAEHASLQQFKLNCSGLTVSSQLLWMRRVNIWFVHRRKYFPSNMDFDSMKYAELQAYAKASGLKANMKAEKLIKALKLHHKKEKKTEEQAKDNAETVPPQDEKDTAFVNKRRGHGKGKKRKMSDTVSEDTTDTAVPSDVAEDPPESTLPEKVQDAKKRKLSSSQDSEKAGPPQESRHSQKKPQPPVKDQNTEKQQRAGPVGKIPRLQKSKPITPNFKKLHEAQFQKMESIDSYFQRRNKQLESCNNSAKEVKKPNPARTSLFSPAPSKKAAEDPRRHTLLSASKAPPKKPARKEEVPFRPSVLSTRRINVRFSEATADNEHKTSLIKTPARMSLCMASSTPQRPAAEAAKPTKTPKPFLFTGNTSMSTTPGTQKKQSFDLKASLSRPLTYKPHAGKLKPFAEVKEKPALNKSLTSNPRQDSYKQHKVQTRDDRRTKTMEGRKQKKDGLLGARRGLVMM